MPATNLLILLVIFMAQHQDMGVSSPITHCTQSRSFPWIELKHRTQDLYRQALKIYNSTMTPDNIVLDDVPRIQCNHLCGPENLVSRPETCLKRIVDVLSYYKSALSHLSTKHKDDDFIRAKEIISDILGHLKGCGHKPTMTAPKPATEEFLRMKIGSPLLSVSILVARVFSPGNPTHHVIHRVHKH